MSDEYGGYLWFTFYVYIDNNLTVTADDYYITVAPGDAVTLSFTVSADDTSDLTYYWYWWDNDDNEYSETTETPSLTLYNVTSSGYYYCRVSDQYDNYEYAYFYVAVDNGLTVDYTYNHYVVSGGTVTLDVVASVTNGGLIYQWYFYEVDEGEDVQLDETGSSLTVDEVTESGEYFCRVSDDYGNYGYAWFYVSVVTELTVSVNETYSSVMLGESADLTLSAVSPYEITWQWYRYDEDESAYVAIEGETNATLTVTPDTVGTFEYVCEVSDGVNSERWSFEVNVYSLSLSYEYYLEVEPGETGTLSVAAETVIDGATISYSWYQYNYLNGSYEAIAGVSGSSLEVSEGGQYRCSVTDGSNTRYASFYVDMNTGLSVTADLRGLLIEQGSTAELSVTATTDYGTLSYLWYKWDDDWENTITLGTSASLTLTDLSLGTYYYYCIVSDSYNSYSLSFCVSVVSEIGETATTAEDAAELEFGSSQLATIANAGDTMYFKVTPETSGTYTFYSNTSRDTVATLYDANLEYLTEDDDSGSGNNFKITCELTEGSTYYLAARYLSDSYVGVFRVYAVEGSDIVDVCEHENVTHVSAAAATCTEAGNSEYWYCNDCGVYFTDSALTSEVSYEDLVISAVGHTWDDGVVTTEPTCTTEGERLYTCTVCGETKTETIEATGHSLIHVAAVDATCTEAGNTEYWYCESCGTYFADEDAAAQTTLAEVTIAATGHTWNDGEVTTAATCTTAGVKTYTCTACGATYTSAIAATGHSLTHYDAVAATCTEAGNIEYWSCSSCGETFSDATGETTVEDVAVAATGHTSVTHVVAVAATCTTAGNTEYWYCEDCGKYFSDEELKTEVSAEDVAIAAKGHDFTGALLREEPTSTTNGKTYYVCQNGCGEIEVVEVLEATGVAGAVSGATEVLGTYTAEDLGNIEDEAEAAEAAEAINSAATDLLNLDNETIIAVSSTTMDEDGTETTTTGMDLVAQIEELVVAANSTIAATVVDASATDESGETTDLGVTVEGAALTLLDTSVTDTLETTEESVLAVMISVSETADGGASSIENSTYEETALDTYALDITMSIVDTANNNEVLAADIEPSTPLRITVAVPTDYQDKEFILVHVSVDSDGNTSCTELTYTLSEDGTTATFTTPSLSTMVFCLTGCSGNHTLIEHEEEAATCIATGMEAYYECSVCGKYFTGSESAGYTEVSDLNTLIIAVTDHTADDWEVTKEPTCTEAGTQTQYCTECGKVLATKSIAATGHADAEHTAAADATCTEKGNIAYWYCSDCDTYFNDESLSEDSEISESETVTEALGHTWDEGVVTEEPTCTEKGGRTYTCTVCGETYEEVIAADAAAHSAVEHVEEEDATCTEGGNIEYWYCADCGKYYIDEALTTEITVSATKTSATGHSWDDGEVTTEATCTTAGVKTYTCTKCGEEKTETIAATGHNWNSGEVTTAATCAKAGVKTYTCTDCDATKTEAIDKLTTHTATGTWVTTKAATCTTAGTRVQYCKYCDTSVIVKSETIAATGHTATGTWVTTKAATCTTTGTRVQYCKDCGTSVVVKSETIAATGHTASTTWTTTKAATCTKAGTKVQKCTKCGTVVNTATIAATGHSYGEWTTTKAATALASGTKTRTCSKCGAKETKSITKLTPTIKVNATSIKLKVKQSTTALKVTGLASGDAVKSWKSSNTKIVTVTSKGKITAKSKTGSAYITITLKSGLTKKIKVTVQKAAVKTTKITVSSKTVSLKKGKTYTIKPTISPITSVQKVTYSSSNKKVATVTAKGKITAKKKGTATITVKSGSKSVKIKVTVK